MADQEDPSVYDVHVAMSAGTLVSWKGRRWKIVAYHLAIGTQPLRCDLVSMDEEEEACANEVPAWSIAIPS